MDIGRETYRKTRVKDKIYKIKDKSAAAGSAAAQFNLKELNIYI